MSTTRCLALLLFLSVLTSISPSTSFAQPRIGDFGFGLILGDPTGLTAKGSIGGGNAWDFAIGSGYLGNLRIHGDYLWNINAFRSSEVGLYLGLGAVIGSGKGQGFIVKGKEQEDEGFRLGLRGVAGINAMPFSAPVELFLEVAPIIAIVPTSGTGTDLAIGVRYYP